VPFYRKKFHGPVLCTLSWATRGSQKVLWIVVEHCNGRTYDNAYLITFKEGPLHTHTHTHTHLLHRSCYCWKHRRKASFGIFQSSAVTYNLMSSMFAKRVLLRPIFWVGNSQKSIEVRSREYGGWMKTGMLFSAKKCCTTSDVWLGALSWCRNHSLCHMSRRFLAEKKTFLSSPNHRTLRISLQVTSGCSLLRKWTSRGRIWNHGGHKSNATAELRKIPKEAFCRCFQQ